MRFQQSRQYSSMIFNSFLILFKIFLRDVSLDYLVGRTDQRKVNYTST